MTVALGIAFRNQPVTKVVVDVIEGPQAEATQSALEGETPTAQKFKAEVVSEDKAKRHLRMGQTDVIVVATGGDGKAADV